MNIDETQRLEAIQSTVITDGWKYLCEDIQEKVDSMKEELLHPNVSLEMLRFGQGRVAVYRELLSLRQVVEHVLDQAKEDAIEDSVDG
jgi:hypothetical protein